MENRNFHQPNHIHHQQITSKSLLLKVFNESKYLRRQPSEPTFHDLITIFYKLSSHYAINSSIEDQCYKALLLFTGDQTMNFQQKILNVEKYLPTSNSDSNPNPNPNPTANSLFSSSSSSFSNDFNTTIFPDNNNLMRETITFQNNSPNISLKKERKEKSKFSSTLRLSKNEEDMNRKYNSNGDQIESDVILLSDLLNGKKSPMISPNKKSFSPVKETAVRSENTPLITTPALTPILKSKKVPSTDSQSFAWSQDNFGATTATAATAMTATATTTTTRFTDSKTHEHSSPLFLSSPLTPAITYVTEIPIETNDPKKEKTITSSPLPHVLKSTNSPSKSVSMAEKYWRQKSLQWGLTRFIRYCHHRNGTSSHRRRQQHHNNRTPEKLTKFKLYQYKKSNKLSSQLSMTGTHHQPPGSPLSTYTESSQQTSSPTSLRDILPTPSTIRILALFEKYIIQCPLGTFTTITSPPATLTTTTMTNFLLSYRHPAPSLYVHMTKLSPRYNLTDPQETWLRTQIIHFLKMETLKICYYVWNEIIGLLILAKEFYKIKLLRRGLEGFQDYSLNRCKYYHNFTSANIATTLKKNSMMIPATEFQRVLQNKLQKYQKMKLMKGFKYLKLFSQRGHKYSHLIQRSQRFHSNHSLLRHLLVWRDHILRSYRQKKQKKLNLKFKIEKEIFLIQIYFQRFYSRVKLFPKGDLLRRRQVYRKKYFIFWKWFHLKWLRNEMKRKKISWKFQINFSSEGEGEGEEEEKGGQGRGRGRGRGGGRGGRDGRGGGVDPLRVERWSDVLLLKYWNKLHLYLQLERNYCLKLQDRSEQHHRRFSLHKACVKWQTLITQKKSKRVIQKHSKGALKRSSSSTSPSPGVGRVGGVLAVSSSFSSRGDHLSGLYHPRSTHPYRIPTLLIYTFYIRWKQFTEKSITRRLKILKYPKQVRLLSGYPINTGQYLISLTSSRSPSPSPPSPSSSPSSPPPPLSRSRSLSSPSPLHSSPPLAHSSSLSLSRLPSSSFSSPSSRLRKTHSSLGYKAYHQIYESSLGSLSSNTAIQRIPTQLYKGFYRFYSKIKKLQSFYLNIQKNHHYYLKKHFHHLLSRLKELRNIRILSLHQISKFFLFWKISFVQKKLKIKKLKKIWKIMKKIQYSKLLLRHWYNKTDLPLLQKSFQKIKLFGDYFSNKTLQLQPLHLKWKIKFHFFEWRQVWLVTRWMRKNLLKKYFHQVFVQNYGRKKKLQNSKIQKYFFKFQKRVQIIHFQKNQIQKYQNYFLFQCFWRKFLSFHAQKNVFFHQQKKIQNWFEQKVSKRCLDHLSEFVERRRRERSLFYFTHLSLSLWKFLRKISKIKSQRVVLKILSNYFLINLMKRSLRRWLRGTKRRIIERKKLQLGRNYFSQQSQSLVITLLKSLSQC